MPEWVEKDLDHVFCPARTPQSRCRAAFAEHSIRWDKMNTGNEEVLLSNKQWSRIDSKMCRILEFHPFASVEDGEILSITGFPYASIVFQCSDQPGILNGFITHKEDFRVLWSIYRERGIGSDEEVLFFWSSRHYKNALYSLLSGSMPKLWVMICRKSSFEIHTDPKFRPDLTGEARWLASQPIEDFKPDAMA